MSTFIDLTKYSILMRLEGGFAKSASVEDLSETGGEAEVLISRSSKLRLISHKITKVDKNNKKEKPLHILTFKEA